MLYGLNAEIRREARRHPNNESIIRNIKIKFKQDNPQLIERLKAQRSRANNCIDTSDNNLSMSNIRQESSNDEAKNSKYSHASIDQPNQILTTQQKLRSRVHDSGEYKENVDIDTIHNLAVTEYQNVKCSTELLNTMMHLDIDNANQNPESPNDADLHEYNYCEEARKNFDSNKDDTVNNIVINEGSILISDVHITEDCIRDDTNDPFTDSDSELAEAMTQIIECSLLNETKDDSEISIDDELVLETVNEINIELESGTVSLEDVVLPPPLEFRD